MLFIPLLQEYIDQINGISVSRNMTKPTQYQKRGMSGLDSQPFLIVDDAASTGSQVVTYRCFGKGRYPLGQFTTI